MDMVLCRHPGLPVPVFGFLARIFNNVLQLVLNIKLTLYIYISIYITTQVPYILIMRDLYVRHCWRLSVKLPLCIMVSLG